MTAARKMTRNAAHRLATPRGKGNPLRYDPTRTGTLRKSFAQKIRRAFQILRGRIVQLVKVDDAFGLGRVTANQFCPTGEGGGVDATCSPSGGSASPGIVGRVTSRIKASYARMKERYGSVGAKLVMGAVVALLPVPIPGTSLVPVGIAEGIRGIGRLFRGKVATANEEFGLGEDLFEDGFQLLLQAYRDALEEVPDDLREQYRHQLRKLKNAPTSNASDFAFHTDPQKIVAFQRWLKVQLLELVIGRTQEELWEEYTRQGFLKGAGRTFDDWAARHPEAAEEGLDFYRGSRQEFLRSSFSRPESVEKVKLLAGRSFDDLENITVDMSTKMSRVLTDGLVQGKHPLEMADELVDQVGLSEQRAEMVARTEIIRAHAEGQLQAMDDLGVAEVGVQVEWSTAAGDTGMFEEMNVCPECAAMSGSIFSIDDARGMIPLHPNCRCAFIPVLPDLSGKPTENRRRDWRAALLANFARSGLRHVHNAYCPTGEGGGQDNSCSPRGGTTGAKMAPAEKVATVVARLAKQAGPGGLVHLADVRKVFAKADRKDLDRAIKQAIIERRVTGSREEGREGSTPERKSARIDLPGDDHIGFLAPRTENRSYFTDCERDERGHCLPAGGASEGFADSREQEVSVKLARSKVKNAPVPSADAVEKARAELELAAAGKIRAGGENRGGGSKDRARQRFNLFKEFGGLEKGYVVCPWTGLKMHHTDDPKENPNGYPKLERGKIFTKAQGGGYQLANLIPESFAANRSRNSKPLRKENQR